MKRILITGADSYIGTSFASYCKGHGADAYHVDTIDMRDPAWESFDFSGYDAVFHVAGLAHLLSRKAAREQAALFYTVNTDLAYKTAGKAKAAGVRHFVFMSSMSIYGDSVPVGRERIITADTLPSPTGAYGRSKLAAEERLQALCDEQFHLAILRPPMVYGRGCPGNYPLLVKFATKLPLFPKVNNRRSMLYIDNLCEFVRLVIERGDSGVFHPQNAEYTNTSDMVAAIASAHGKRIRMVRGVTWLLCLASVFTKRIGKAFGSLLYDASLSDYPLPYASVSLAESIRRTECEQMPSDCKETPS